MKIYTTLLFLIVYSTLTVGQEITGTWNGQLNIKDNSLRLVFKIYKDNGRYSATMDSPDQGAFGIPVSEIDYTNKIVRLKITPISFEYSGVFNGETIKGTLSQGGQNFEIELSRNETNKTEVNRPQTPKKPYPYLEENVEFENKDAHITLAGTLTLPKNKGPHPAVILITGSGAQNRNEEILRHKPFLVIADYLTKNGIAVLRYDDRGTAASTGDFKTATTNDFAQDATWAFRYLASRPEINNSNIGLIGHSEGGIIAPIVSLEESNVAFIVLMAGTGVIGYELLLEQQKDIALANGLPTDVIKKNIALTKNLYEFICSEKTAPTFKDDLRKLLDKLLTESPLPKSLDKTTYIAQQMALINTPWFLNFLSYNPGPTLAKITCPVLAINGSKDLQVNSTTNLNAIKQQLESAENSHVSIIEFEGLNHLFQTCKTGNPTEYGNIKETFSPKALEAILAWIHLQVSN